MKEPMLPASTYPLQRKITLTAVVFLVVVVAVVELGSARVRHHLGKQQGRDEVRIELTSNGFAPSEVQHTPGTFAIAVENNILSGEYRLKLKAEDGTVLNEFQVQKGSSAWTVSLQTGRYMLTEANHSQWICNFTIQ